MTASTSGGSSGLLTEINVTPLVDSGARVARHHDGQCQRARDPINRDRTSVARSGAADVANSPLLVSSTRRAHLSRSEACDRPSKFATARADAKAKDSDASAIPRGRRTRASPGGRHAIDLLRGERLAKSRSRGQRRRTAVMSPSREPMRATNGLFASFDRGACPSCTLPRVRSAGGAAEAFERRAQHQSE